jgi:non-heme chloroperoxidase
MACLSQAAFKNPGTDERRTAMPYISVGKENSGSIDIYYEDHGSGKPVVLIHGWPLSGASWEKQVPVLLEAGYRIITYDRRGFGKSSRPTSGYDYDTMAEDLNRLMTKLGLHHVTLVGFSMGGGEVARYIGSHGSKRLEKAVFMAAVTPFLLKTPDNPEGVEESVFDETKKAIVADRPALISAFLSNFFNADVLRGTRISDDAVRACWNIAADASPRGTLDCVSAWLEDFRKDLKCVEVPTLVIHGDADRILPLASTGKRMPDFIGDCRLSVIKDGPHGLNWTHADEVNRELLAFLAAESLVGAAGGRA